MSQMKLKNVSYAVLGDVVGSRESPHRAELHRTLTAALAQANDTVEPVRPLRVTVGDEFQGVYATLGDALAATFSVQLALLPAVDTRFGLGAGEITVLDAERGIEDGPAWWRAREATRASSELADRAASRRVRISYRPAEDDQTAAAVNAALNCRDQLVKSLPDRSVRLLRGIMADQPQAALALAEGISDSAVSQHVVRHGLGVIRIAQTSLQSLP